MTNANQQNQSQLADFEIWDTEPVHTNMHQWAHRVKRLLNTKSQVSAGLSRFVIDAEIEPYRVYYRKHGALGGESDQEMLKWFSDQPE